jgi:hypothetical protein
VGQRLIAKHHERRSSYIADDLQLRACLCSDAELEAVSVSSTLRSTSSSRGVDMESYYYYFLNCLLAVSSSESSNGGYKTSLS